MSDKPNYVPIGGLWEGTTKRGTPYLKGKLNIDGRDVWVTIFPNERKLSTADRAPDYFVQALVWEAEESEPHPF